MTSIQHPIARGRPSFWLSLLVCLGLVAVMGYARLYLYRDHLVPMADGMALLICLWLRDRRMLWGMTLIFTAVAFIKVAFLLPLDQRDEPHEWVAAAMLLFNIWLVAGVVHVLIGARQRLEEKNTALEAVNCELVASNEDLAARDEEISRQNEELQSQTEELEQQTEELTRQGEELQSLNEDLSRRERALQTLLESSRWLRTDAPQRDVMANICHAASQAMEQEVSAAAIVVKQGDRLVVCGHWGFSQGEPIREDWSFDRSFACLVVARGQTAYLADISRRPDLEILQPPSGPPFRSILASPLRVEGHIIGAVEVYSQERREWTDEDFRVIEWLAAQSALVLESLHLQQELELRRRDAEEASIRKTRFLAAVSHDVRTPANAINLMAELIARASRDPSMASQLPQLASDLHANARSLVALVSDVLDLARFDSGRLDLQESSFAVCAMVQAEVRQLMPLANAKGLRLVAEPPPQPIWLRADRMKLVRVVGNLIGNAIKFTETGGVRAQCLRLPDGSAEIRVIDTGIGISAEHLTNIFDEFYQLRNPERDRSKGTGLGLAICKRLLDATGCRITVQSVAGQGSTFTLSIPPSLIIPAPEQPLPTGAEPPAPDSRRGRLADLRVLLVEDHDTTRRATAQLLVAEGAIVAQAGTGQAAIHMLAHDLPHVLLLDLMLPDIDGSEILRRLCEHRPPSLRCVLVVSGDVTESRAQEVKQLGADGLIAKPIEIHKLVAAISAATAEPAPLSPPLRVT